MWCGTSEFSSKIIELIKAAISAVKMVNRMSGALRTSDSSGSVATTSQGSLAGGLNGGSINGPTSPSTSTSSPTSPQQEVLTNAHDFTSILIDI